MRVRTWHSSQQHPRVQGAFASQPPRAPTPRNRAAARGFCRTSGASTGMVFPRVCIQYECAEVCVCLGGPAPRLSRLRTCYPSPGSHRLNHLMLCIPSHDINRDSISAVGSEETCWDGAAGPAGLLGARFLASLVRWVPGLPALLVTRRCNSPDALVFESTFHPCPARPCRGRPCTKVLARRGDEVPRIRPPSTQVFTVTVPLSARERGGLVPHPPPGPLLSITFECRSIQGLINRQKPHSLMGPRPIIWLFYR